MATRKVIRPKFASAQDGYSRESIEDMLVAWSAFWADVPKLRERVESLRTDSAAEPMLASIWTLRMSKDELAIDRAKKSLNELVPLGPEIVGLALRDPEFAKFVFHFQPTPGSFEAWLSTLVAGRAPRHHLARGLTLLWQREDSSWNADTGWTYSRTLDEQKSKALEALLDSPIEEVRGALAVALADAWPRDPTWLVQLFVTRLEDPIVGTVVCRWMHYGSRLPKDQALAKLKGTFSDRLPHRVDFLAAMATLGDTAPAMTHFKSLTPKEQGALVSSFYGSAAGKRFLEDVIRDEKVVRSVRRDAYLMVGNVPALEPYAWLLER
ncbi:MAG: hypothetical protein JNM17_16290 [Archangium sp.]|nr:hypothetical protein [Archangium sp.]